MRARRLIPVAVAALVSVAVTACGGSSPHGIAAKTPTEIVAEATHAINQLRSVRVSGAVDEGSRANRLTLDLSLVNGRGATGALSEHGLSFRLVSVHGVAYVNGSAGFWRAFGGASALSRLRGHWLRAPADSGDFASFSALTDAHRLLSRLLAGHGTLTLGSESEIDGRRVIAVRDASRDGTLYVAAQGTPYPIRITNGAGVGGAIDFSAFNGRVSLRPPASSIDITTLHG